MDKQSNLNIPCTYCDKDALPNTDPPVCAEHKAKGVVRKRASARGDRCDHDTLKELTSGK